MKVPLSLLAVAAVVVCAAASTQNHPDQILNLPGAEGLIINYNQFSGYLNATGSKKLHYWFVESQGNPSTDPVMLWMNGGPGCSSMDGILYEHGPLLINEDGNTFRENPHAWNKYASVLYLESPVGVGYSYSPNPADYSTDDDTTSNDNYHALLSFFNEYSEFANNDFYVSGESYGGIYTPTLVKRIKDGNALGVNPIINLKGFAVGNGMFDYRLNDNSVIPLWYAHGMIEDSVFNQLKQECCTGVLDSTCNFHDPSPASQCYNTVTNVMTQTYSDGINIYNLEGSCFQSSSSRTDPRLLRAKQLLFPNNAQYQKLVASERQRNGNKGWEYLQMQRTNELKGQVKLGANPPCIDSVGGTIWMNKPEVKEALHIPSTLPMIKEWAICSDVLQYNRTYMSVVPLYNDLLSSYRALVYNGDVDAACNFLGDEWATSSLKRTVVENRRVWLDASNQVNGFVKEYDNLTVLTVRGAGHMVPQDKPAVAEQMIATFLKNGKY